MIPAKPGEMTIRERYTIEKSGGQVPETEMSPEDQERFVDTIKTELVRIEFRVANQADSSRPR